MLAIAAVKSTNVSVEIPKTPTSRRIPSDRTADRTATL
jgi:hypothetical protein